jgi:hypothetical protein
MIGLNVKRGVAATMERVTANAGLLFSSLQVVWTGKGAGIRFERCEGKVDATVILPSIDDLKEVSNQTFNNLIAFALHEGLGHAVYTDNEPWDEARDRHGAFLGNLINGLEDPRIERCAIESGFAPNAKQLFENLLNSMLERDGYPEAGDIKNIPFLLAVEGRRLNGYQVNCPCVIDQSPFAADLWVALSEAQASKSTAGVVRAAIKLLNVLQAAQKKSDPNGKGDDESQPTDDPDGSEQGSDEGDQDGDQDGDQEGGKSGDNPSGKAGDKPSDKQGDEASDKQDGKDGDQQGNQSSKGWSDEAGRTVEPTSFIEGELKDLALSSDEYNPRPFAGKPQIATFHWE